MQPAELGLYHFVERDSIFCLNPKTFHSELSTTQWNEALTKNKCFFNQKQLACVLKFS